VNRVPFFVGVAFVLAALVTGISVQASFDAQRQSAPPHAKPEPASGTPGLPAAVMGADPQGTGEMVEAWSRFVTGILEREAADREAWIAGVLAFEAEQRAREVRPRVSGAPTVAARPVDVWDQLAQCESGGDWSYNGPSGFDGGLQFHPSTWTNSGGGEFAEYAWQASREQQIIVAERVLASSGWSAWPACASRLGLR